ncbi:MAG: NADH-quinone oxidoreductase subunit NuoF [Anaerolineales bacterium]|jgi:NADH-quinone oxidoreductase subunit F
MMDQIKQGSDLEFSEDLQLSIVNEVMARFDHQEHGLIETLLAAQEAYGFVSRDIMEYISKNLGVPLSKTYGVATFYDNIQIDEPATTDCIICTGPSCSIAGAEEILNEVCDHVSVSKPGQTSKDGKVRVHRGSCLGLCDHAPAAMVGGKAQVHIQPGQASALLKGELQTPDTNIQGDVREITGAIGKLPSVDLNAHIEEGAFSGLEKALFHMTPEQVIAEVKESRLAGRGGAGFPTGLKWELARKAQAEPKYVVCNFDESEPGTFKDRVMMEGDPYRVIEGLMIGAYATNAHTGYIFIRGEYPHAQDSIQEALHQLYNSHRLGSHIFDSDYDLDIEIRKNAGAYICGEETALFEAVEGKRGLPRIKPPYPTQSGLFGQPTAINNVETLAIVPSLIVHGGEWFQQWGTEKSVGLKLFCLSGHVNNPCLIEAPYGRSVRELVEEFGGGFKGEPQAILVGGAAGGFLTPDELDVPLTVESLSEYDVPIGSGAIVVFNQSVDMWQILEQLASFFVHESCGQCAPCRIGTKQIFRVLQKVNKGLGTEAEVRKAQELAETIRATCICGLGMTAANPFLSHLRNS